MSASYYILGGLAGLIFGSAVAFINSRITKAYLNRSEKKERENPDKPSAGGVIGVMLVNFLRLIISAGALLLVFLLRKMIPLPFNSLIIGTAVGLTLISFVFLYITVRNR